ncbi:Zinc finger, GRF-type [Sesbania bispinosa]|nr:Zinc finger, GRF-type [Sesbania bispinosa]
MASNSDRRGSIGSGGSRSSQQKKVEHPGGRCFCNMRAVIRVSGTDASHGRLFYSCPKLKVNDRCNFFLWVDNEGGVEDTYSMTEATSVMAPTVVEDEEWKRNVTQKLCNVEAEIRRLSVCMLFVFSVLCSAIIFWVGYSVKK